MIGKPPVLHQIDATRCPRKRTANTAELIPGLLGLYRSKDGHDCIYGGRGEVWPRLHKLD